MPTADPSASAAPGGSARPREVGTWASCKGTEDCLTKCAYCDPRARHNVERALNTCKSGCPPIVAAKSAPTSVPARLHGIVVGASSTAYGRCKDLGGDYLAASPSEHGQGYVGKCMGAPGPWGLEAEWWIGEHDDKVARVEMRFPVAKSETAADLARWVAHLVTEELGAPNKMTATSYTWMPASGIYWSIVTDSETNEVLLFAKEQL